ncbi:GbsR/MarR family transcriptional regulator [Amycolatopsis anabasis]|uniref:GbsR/MarR family transcriptional regulator n=1 Tax=Amycolatopsis anabasis TaxID=1840409 RepID=UPI001FE54872|nr:MarR family transcriptional regulator [Amycolatopsis anabasis]
MTRLSPGEREFIDRMGLSMEKFGGPRTMGRIYGWLLICDPPEQSLTEMAKTLEVSKASISTVIRQLQEGGMVERVPVADRQHHYRVTPGGFTQVLRTQMAQARIGIDAVELGLSVLGPDRPEQRERLEDVRDFFTFLGEDAEEFIQRWEEYRKRKKRSGR